MDINEYMTKRVDDQINWYDKKSIKAQKYYKLFQIIEIILASTIPVLSIFSTNNIIVATSIAICGGLIAIIESITRLYKFHENWIEYRTTSELLKYHKFLYITKTYPYNDSVDTIENIFIKNIENIISSENNNWKTLNSNYSYNSDSKSSTAS